MPTPPNPADTAAAAAAHLWHLVWQLGNHPKAPASAEMVRYRDLATDLTVLSEVLRGPTAAQKRAARHDSEESKLRELRSSIGRALDYFEGHLRGHLPADLTGNREYPGPEFRKALGRTHLG